MSAEGPSLVTGFEPFGGEAINASWEAVQLLPDSIEGSHVERRLLPVEFGRSGDVLCDELDRLSPTLVLAVGEAGGRAHVSVERVALNIMSARMPDNAGFAPQGEPVLAGAPDALLATLPVDACVDAARTAGVPTDASETAGLYVCNQLMYRLLYALRTAGKKAPAGFVHVPYVAEQVLERKETPFMPADYAARALVAIARAALC
ncbi:MAG: pyroglutamyl-peptidase I [Atopobiaceae bacterium]|nr:pyroglutamyl-peptidase I [Atopobiaceae bacterium]